MRTIDYGVKSFTTRKTLLLGLIDNAIGVLFLMLFAITTIGIMALLK